MNRLTFHASPLPHSPGGGAPRTTVPARSARGAHTAAAISAGTDHAASDASHEPSHSSSGTASAAASAAPSGSAIEYAPVSLPVASGWVERM